MVLAYSITFCAVFSLYMHGYVEHGWMWLNYEPDQSDSSYSVLMTAITLSWS